MLCLWMYRSRQSDDKKQIQVDDRCLSGPDSGGRNQLVPGIAATARREVLACATSLIWTMAHRFSYDVGARYTIPFLTCVSF